MSFRLLQKRWFIALEFLLLFIGFPVIAWLEWFQVSIFVIYLIPVLWSIAVYFMVIGPSLQDTGEPPRKTTFPDPGQWIVKTVCIVGGIALLAWLLERENFLGIPRHRPGLWAIILVFYPLISVAPQEFLYRVFYFHRYNSLFPGKTMLLVSNTLVFAGLHVMYDNWLAPALTLAGGWLFALSWHRHHNFLLLWLEHALYGLAIFTFGLGRYFFEAPGQ